MNDQQQRQSFQLSDYEDLKESLNRSTAQWYLGGGQAINLWGELYQETLEPYAPFTSHDIDIVVSGEEVSSLQEPFQVSVPDDSALCGVIHPCRGEILHFLPGTLQQEAENHKVSVNGWPTVSPALLLKAKLWNLFNIDQSIRKDRRHLLIMEAAIEPFLKDPRFVGLHQTARDTIAYLQDCGCVEQAHAAGFNLFGRSPLWESTRQGSQPVRIYLSKLISPDVIAEPMKQLGEGYCVLPMTENESKYKACVIDLPNTKGGAYQRAFQLLSPSINTHVEQMRWDKVDIANTVNTI